MPSGHPFPVFLSQREGRRPVLRHRFIQGVSGRFFTDQAGLPILVEGDSPWSATVKCSPAEWATYCASRAAYGVNAVIVASIGNTFNGGVSDDGATYDGILPFTSGNLTAPVAAYWARVDQLVATAAEHGITVFLYAIDGWSAGTGGVFAGKSNADCQAFGEFLGARYRSAPNIMWMFGGDYDSNSAGGTAVDLRMSACLTGIRVHDQRPVSIQMHFNRSASTVITSSNQGYWASRVAWNFCYSYVPNYEIVATARASSPIPALYSEGNYDALNLHGDTPDTTAETIRRQAGWALSYGSPGDIAGTSDWGFPSGWADRLTRVSFGHLQKMRAAVKALRDWHLLVPDTGSALVTAGRGSAYVHTTDATPITDILDSTYVTASRTPDGRLAVVYNPDTRNSITVATGQMAAGATARWVDPTTGVSTPTTFGSTFVNAAANSAGQYDRLLILEA